MKEYDLIAIGTGSVMNILNGYIARNADARVAVIDRDEPGGICLTRGCIPSKILFYPVELLSDIWKAGQFGINLNIKNINFKKIMNRMRRIIRKDIAKIEKGLKSHPNIDYYRAEARFIAPYTLVVNGEEIKADKIFICSGSRPLIPKIKGLEETGYLTSDTLLQLKNLPESLAIIGGGYIAVEYGNFFAKLGSKVKVIEMLPRILANEEPELSHAVENELRKFAELHTSQRVVEIKKEGDTKKIITRDSENRRIVVEAEEILLAAGRASNSDILEPEKGGIKTDRRGWILVNEYLETSQPGVYALGDANGKFMLKNVANQEAKIVFYNAVLGKMEKMSYDIVPYAVFTEPEIASVGLKEKEAIDKYGKNDILIGYERYKDTGKGIAMNAEGFVKIILKKDGTILGAHIAGKNASILIQEVVNLMYARAGSHTMLEAMHIHPALSEAVKWAFTNPMDIETYHRARN